MSMKVSRTLVINSLCCAIGPVLAWNLWWVIRYWPALVCLGEDVYRCVAVALR